MSQAEAQVANGGMPLEAAPYLQIDMVSALEGWRLYGNQIDQADIHILDEAFAGLDITGPVVPQNWIHDMAGQIFPNPAVPVLGTSVIGVVG
jgi:hypothetical protein